jgi:hypothetical protein
MRGVVPLRIAISLPINNCSIDPLLASSSFFLFLSSLHCLPLLLSRHRFFLSYIPYPSSSTLSLPASLPSFHLSPIDSCLLHSYSILTGSAIEISFILQGVALAGHHLTQSIHLAHCCIIQGHCLMLSSLVNLEAVQQAHAPEPAKQVS